MFKLSENQTICPFCKKAVPLNKDSKIVSHYTKTQSGFGRKSKTFLCKGSGGYAND